MYQSQLLYITRASWKLCYVMLTIHCTHIHIRHYVLLFTETETVRFFCARTWPKLSSSWDLFGHFRPADGKLSNVSLCASEDQGVTCSYQMYYVHDILLFILYVCVYLLRLLCQIHQIHAMDFVLYYVSVMKHSFQSLWL